MYDEAVYCMDPTGAVHMEIFTTNKTHHHKSLYYLMGLRPAYFVYKNMAMTWKPVRIVGNTAVFLFMKTAVRPGAEKPERSLMDQVDDRHLLAPLTTKASTIIGISLSQ